MKVHQIISESQDLKEWNPIDAVKKKLGSKTAATKMDIDAETKELAGEFTAFYKNTPDGAPTTENLFNYLKKKGLPVGSEQDIVNVLSKLGKRMGQKVGGALKKAGQGIVNKAKAGTAAVGRGIDKIKQAGATGIKPEPQQGELDFNSVVYESAYNILKEQPLQPADVTRIINHYVKSGFSGTAGGFGKSKYAGGKAPAGAKPQAKAAGNTTIPKGTKTEGPHGVGEFTADGNGGWIAKDGTPLKPDHPYNKKLDALVKGGAKPQAKAAGSAVGNTGDPQLDKAIELVQANGYQVTK